MLSIQVSWILGYNKGVSFGIYKGASMPYLFVALKLYQVASLDKLCELFAFSADTPLVLLLGQTVEYFI